MDTRMLFAVLKNSEMQAAHATLQRCLEVLTWSFGALATGMHPATDELGEAFGPGHEPERAAKAGTPLACGLDGLNLLGAWCEMRGDWEFLRDALHLANHYGPGAQICHLCGASRDPGLTYYGDFSNAAAHRATLVGPHCRGERAWKSHAPISPLCRLPGFSVWRCMFDFMHTMDLGLLQRCIPAALQGLLGLPPGKSRKAHEAPFWPGGRKEQRIKLANADYVAWAKRTKVPASSRIKRITGSWVHGRFPCISMEHAKAAGVRAMLPWVAEKAEARAESSPAAALRARVLTGLAKMDACYRGQGRFLSLSSEEEAKGHCLSALAALAELAGHFPDGPWRLQPKAHALVHIACDAVGANPRVLHCYQDEDFVGCTKELYRACHGRTAPRRVVQRYMLGTALQLVAREELLAGRRAPRAAALRGGPLARVGGSAAASSAAAPAAAAPAGAKRGPGRPPKLLAKRPKGRPRKPAA